MVTLDEIPQIQILALGDELSPRSTESLCVLLAMTRLRIPLVSLHIVGCARKGRLDRPRKRAQQGQEVQRHGP
jgi:hypothetical protein